MTRVSRVKPEILVARPCLQPIWMFGGWPIILFALRHTGTDRSLLRIIRWAKSLGLNITGDLVTIGRGDFAVSDGRRYVIIVNDDYEYESHDTFYQKYPCVLWKNGLGESRKRYTLRPKKTPPSKPRQEKLI